MNEEGKRTGGGIVVELDINFLAYSTCTEVREHQGTIQYYSLGKHAAEDRRVCSDGRTIRRLCFDIDIVIYAYLYLNPMDSLLQQHRLRCPLPLPFLPLTPIALPNFARMIFVSRDDIFGYLPYLLGNFLQ